MKWKLAVLGAVFIGCQSSPESSFRNLNKAFISWYFKYHPVESTRYGMNDNNGNFREISISGREEYSADISRFLIELSQIDATKISPEARIDYNILYSKLEQVKLIVEVIKPWEWNPLWTLDEIITGFYILSEREQINMDDRVEAVPSRLVHLPQLLNNSKEMLTAYSLLHTQHSREKIEKLIHLLQQLPLKLNSDNMTLDKIDRLIKRLIGHKLITFTVIDYSKKYVERIYTNNLKVYPLLGTKKLPKNKWSKTVIKNKKHFLGKNKKDIKKLFFDHDTIFSLGCGSIINFLVKFNNTPIGTINVLDKEYKYSQSDIKKLDIISGFMIPFFLEHQFTMKKNKGVKNAK